MRYYQGVSCSKDGTLSVEFLIVDLGKSLGWRAYILSDIYYQRFSADRSGAQLDVHKLSEDDTYLYSLVINFMRNNPPMMRYGRRPSSVEYVCWTKSIYDLNKMKTIASAWVDITAYYIQYGGSFPEIKKKLCKAGVI